MSNMFTAECFARVAITGSAGVTYSEKLPLEAGENYNDVFKFAHSDPDGLVPRLHRPATAESAYAWSQAVALRELEARLVAKCNAGLLRKTAADLLVDVK